MTRVLSLSCLLCRWVILAALMLGGMMPASVMPHLADDGTMTVVICSGDGPLELRLDAETGEPVEDDGGDEHRSSAGCHLNGLRDAGVFASTVEIPVTAVAARPLRDVAIAIRTLHALPYPRPLTRAPPSAV